MPPLSEGVLFGLGNPLLDISANVDKEFLAKYELKANNAILADDSHKGLCEEMVSRYKDEVEYLAGGSVQNSMRVAQWFIAEPNRCTFMGAVGDDQYGQTMAEIANKGGVNVMYRVDQTEKTGTCACLITNHGKNRSLCAFLGASQTFTLQHLLENHVWVEKATVFYTSGFHLAVSPQSILHLAEHAHKNAGKTFCMNLSATYISQVFAKQLLEVFPFADVLFGNNEEAEAFAKLKNYETTDMKAIAQRMADDECRRETGRTVVITQGTDAVLVAKTKGKQVLEFEVPRLEESKIVDTNGAGDAFAGGFLAQYVQNEPLSVCVNAAIYAASQVIQMSGCQFPKENKFRK